MVAVRKNQAGFTLTELMVVVVILALLAAVSQPLFRRDNTARKGRNWANVVAQGLQKARFQAMGERNNIHFLLYRDHFETWREAPTDPPQVIPSTSTSGIRLGTVAGPEATGDKTIAIWDAAVNGSVPSYQNEAIKTTPASLVFLPTGNPIKNETWRIYIRNELLPAGHPDASFFIKVHGLTGLVSSNEKRTLP